MDNSSKNNQNSNTIYGGLALLIIGIIFLTKNLGADIPHWIVSWPMLLILIGIVNGLKHQFKKQAAFIFIGVGILFLLKKFVFISISIFPVLLIAAGIWIILKPYAATQLKA